VAFGVTRNSSPGCRPFHAACARKAGKSLVAALPAGGLVTQAGFEYRAVFGRERRLLGASRQFGLVVTIAAGGGERMGPDQSG